MPEQGCGTWHPGRLQVAKKAKKEMLPATKLYSDRSRAPDATHEVSREHEYKDATDPDALVPPEERQKAYKVASLLPCTMPCVLRPACTWVPQPHLPTCRAWHLAQPARHAFPATQSGSLDS